MIIRINGKNEEITNSINLADFIKGKGFKERAIVVEYNNNIIPQEDWHNVLLQDNDVLEIVSFVSGG